MKFVTISSNIDITVTNGLLNVDKTNYYSRIGNNLNIAPVWSRTAVHVKQGKHLYPAEIAAWPSVKALDAKGIFTIGAETDEGSEEEMKMLEEFEASKTAVNAELAAASSKKRRRKADDIPEAAE